MTWENKKQDEFLYINSLGILSVLNQENKLQKINLLKEMEKQFKEDLKNPELLDYIKENPLSLLSLETTKNTNSNLFDPIQNLLQKINQKS
jgi:hypothetical protein